MSKNGLSFALSNTKGERMSSNGKMMIDECFVKTQEKVLIFTQEI